MLELRTTNSGRPSDGLVSGSDFLTLPRGREAGGDAGEAGRPPNPVLSPVGFLSGISMLHFN